MQQVTETQAGVQNVEILRPFGPCIIKATIPEQVQQDLIGLFERNYQAGDHSPNLAGNMLREFTIDDKTLDAEQAQRFVQMLADGSAELYKYSKIVQWENLKRTATQRHKEIVDGRINEMNLNCIVHQSWGNISVAGDFNPMHSHTGMISGVGYLRMPDDIEAEWEAEDHDPSAGLINFMNSNSANLMSHNLRIKPEVGVIYFFPAWLQHEVYPFRSGGERWSFSFKTTIENLNSDVELTNQDKIDMYEARTGQSVNAQN